MVSQGIRWNPLEQLAKLHLSRFKPYGLELEPDEQKRYEEVRDRRTVLGNTLNAESSYANDD